MMGGSYKEWMIHERFPKRYESKLWLFEQKQIYMTKYKEKLILFCLQVTKQERGRDNLKKKSNSEDYIQTKML